jgi:hypothetical protein
MPANPITQVDLWNAVNTLGTDGDVTSIRTDVTVKLVELKIAKHGANGLQLTPYGKKAFVVLESSDGRVYEFEDFRPAGE